MQETRKEWVVWPLKGRGRDTGRSKRAKKMERLAVNGTVGVTKEHFLKGDASGSGCISARYNPSPPLSHLLPILTAYSQISRRVH